jgi:hypothetical protein
MTTATTVRRVTAIVLCMAIPLGVTAQEGARDRHVKARVLDVLFPLDVVSGPFS